MKRFGMLVFMLLMHLPMMVSHAQESPLPLPLAVEYQRKLYVMKTMPHSIDDLPAALTLIDDNQDFQYYGSTWSPDGTKLIYRSKYVWDGSQTFELVNSIQGGYPLGWTADGQIVYMNLVNPTSAIDYTAQVYTLALEAGAKPTLVIDNLPVQAGCGMGAELPMENRLRYEVGGVGNLRPLIALTAYGLIYPAKCDGSISLYRPTTGENFTLANGNLVRAVLSPDGSRLAGIDYGARKIVVVDLFTVAETTLNTTEAADVVAWGQDGNLYYAAVSKNRNLLDELSPEKSAQVFALLSSNTEFVSGNTVHLYRRAPDGSETLLHEQDAYAVGKLVFKDNTLIYSTIANGDAWVQAMADGTLGAQEIYSNAAYAYTSTALNYITFKADGSVGETGTLPGDLQRLAVP